MKDTLFVQYCYENEGRSDPYYSLTNGFSDTYDLCKSKGDFHWLMSSYEDRECPTLPINKGTVYISCLCLDQIYKTYLMAKRYPNIKFIVGGPTIQQGVLHIKERHIPSNFIMISQTVEDYFGVANFSYKWKLDMPYNLMNKKIPIMFSYVIDNYCYWGKCIFCRAQNQDSINYNYRKREDFKFEFKELEGDDLRIWLTTDAINSKKIKTILPKLPSGFTYTIFMRGTKSEIKAVKYLLENTDNKFVFCVGVEFPSKRMIKYINKGIDLDDIIELAHLISKYGSTISLFYILGWDNLTIQDVLEADNFIKSLPDDGVIQKVRRLLNMCHTQIYNDCYHQVKDFNLYNGPFKSGYYLKISDDQKALNDKAFELMIKRGYPTIDDYNKKFF